MKKSLFLSALAATMLLATSCQEDALLNTNPGEKATVTFSLATPEIATRAYSDGTTAQELQYAVYDANGNYLDKLTGAKEINLKTQVQLQLTTGNTYTLVFWADAATAPYTVDFANKKMTIDYTGVKSNREDLDAFYRDTTFVVTGNMNVDIELYRPFAQLNIGTDDLEATANAGYPVTTASVKVKTYNTFNFIDETVDGFAEVNFAEEVLPTEAFPVKGYEYIAMNYLLMTADKSVVDEVVLSYGAEPKTRTFKAIPLQRNYRTNIYGQMFTSDVDVNVEIIPTYNEPAYTILDAFENGGVATLTENVLLNQPLVVKSGVKAVLELNGQTITNKAANKLTDVILVEEGAELTINGDGVVEAVSDNDGYAVIANGKLTINGGTFRSGIDQNGESNAVIYARGKGEVYINGGTFEKSEGDAGFVVNKKDADRATTTIEIRGGMFKGFNPANNAAEGANTNFCATGYNTVQEGDYHRVFYTGGVSIDLVVNDLAGLKDALKDASIYGIGLAAGTYDLDAVQYLAQKKALVSIDPANQAVVAGKLVANADFMAVNVAFKPNATTATTLNTSTYGSKVNSGYAAIVQVNKVAATFEGCTFTDLNSGCAINYFVEAAGKVLNVNNCTFVGTSKGIYSKVLCSVTNCTFDLNGGVPLYVWPRAYEASGECTFTGNNAVSEAYTCVGLLTQSGNYANTVFNVQNNTGEYLYTYAWTNSVRCDNTVTFAPGSKTFTINPDGTIK